MSVQRRFVLWHQYSFMAIARTPISLRIIEQKCMHQCIHMGKMYEILIHLSPLLRVSYSLFRVMQQQVNFFAKMYHEGRVSVNSASVLSSSLLDEISKASETNLSMGLSTSCALHRMSDLTSLDWNQTNEFCTFLQCSSVLFFPSVRRKIRQWSGHLFFQCRCASQIVFGGDTCHTRWRTMQI